MSKPETARAQPRRRPLRRPSRPNRSCVSAVARDGQRAYVESLGYDIVANFGDQFSDLDGGFADKTFKMPNPNYYVTG